MNRRLNLPQLQQIMRDFERQNERMEMTSEMMGDAVDDAFEVRRSQRGCGCCHAGHGSCWGVWRSCKQSSEK